MWKIVTLVFAVCLFVGSGIASAQQATTGTTSATPTTVDEVLKAVRGDLQNDRTDLMAKNLTLTSDQAAKFWPMFASYQKEQSLIIDEHLRAIQTFIEGFDELDEPGALAFLNGHFDRDAKMNDLRRKWLPQFQQALGTKLAVRAMQIDRRLSLVQQLAIASKIPLSH